MLFRSMVEVIGIGSVGDSEIAHTDSNDPAIANAQEQRVYVKLNQALNSKQEFYEQYLKGIEHLYFRLYVKLNGEKTPGDKPFPIGYDRAANGDVYDYVTGYCKIKGSGYGLQGSNTNEGYFTVETVPLAKGKPTSIHPFTAAAIQYTRLMRPSLAA